MSFETDALMRLRRASRIGFVFTGGSARCALLLDAAPQDLFEVRRDRGLRSTDALPLLISVTRLSDRAAVLFDAAATDDPLQLLLASNYLPPFYTRAPQIGGVRYGDGGLSDNFGRK